MLKHYAQVTNDHFERAIGGKKSGADVAQKEAQQVIAPDGTAYSFEVAPFRKYCLVNGLDDIGLTLRHADKIKAYEAERILKMPWLTTQLP